MHLPRIFFLCVASLMPEVVNAQTNCGDASSMYPYYHGVASGDATQHEVIIWTRISPNAHFNEIEVKWKVATDEEMSFVVDEGTFITNKERDYTVKVDAQNLQADTWYFYTFEALGYISMTGRTKTLPSQGKDDFVFAVFSCSNYERGYFNAYHHAAASNAVQAVFHLGDYYYESFGGNVLPDRSHAPNHALYSLNDYRIRHAQTCADVDVQELRRQFPWYVIWDDHEFSDDCWSGGAYGHLLSISSWEARKTASRQAYSEWMPIREKPDGSIYKQFEIGGLAQLIFVDDRIENRSAPVSADSPSVNDTARTILGDVQMNWLLTQVNNSAHVWQIVPSSLIKTPAVDTSGYPLDPDMWEGYRSDRQQLFQFIADNNISNFISIAGDFHASWASDLAYGAYNEVLQTGSVGCELAVCAVTSSPHTVGDISNFLNINPHIKHIEQSNNGYLLCRVAANAMEAEWIYVSTILSKTYFSIAGQKILVESGTPFLSLEKGEMDVQENQEALAATDVTEVWTKQHVAALNEVMPFPNPANDEFHVEWFAHCGGIAWQLFDITGRAVCNSSYHSDESGLQHLTIDTSTLANGVYLIHIEGGSSHLLKQICIQQH